MSENEVGKLPEQTQRTEEANGEEQDFQDATGGAQ